MKIAVVILNWNGERLLKNFLPSVVLYSEPKNKEDIVDIYVGDNDSSDSSLNFVKENFPQIKIIKNETNLGFALGYNKVLEHIEADIFVLLNSDAQPSVAWLEKPIDIFKKDLETAVIQSKILDFKNKSKFEYAGASGGFIDFLGYPFCRGRIFDNVENDVLQYQDVRQIFWASGAAFFVRSEVFKSLGGFDGDFFAHQEEIDFCWRVKNSGKSIKVVPTSIVYHLGGGTLQAHNHLKTFFNFRNSLFLLIKNLPTSYLFIVFPVRFFLDIFLQGSRFLFQGKFKHCFAIWRAYFEAVKSLPKMLKKRKSIKNKTKNYYHCKSIVWQYFIRGKKTFKKL